MSTFKPYLEVWETWLEISYSYELQYKTRGNISRIINNFLHILIWTFSMFYLAILILLSNLFYIYILKLH